MSRLWLQQSRRWRQRRKAKLPTRKPSLRIESLEDRRLMAVLEWSGDIPDGTVWSGTDIHRLTGNVRVPSGATLTIQPGAVVKFNAFNVNLTVDGTLQAHGTEQQPIVFTEIRDDVGGDTNGDGGNSLPAPGNWGNILVSPTATASFDRTQLRYGGFNAAGQLTVDGGNLSVSNSVISRSASDGVRIINSNPTLANNEFQNNVNAAISMDLASDPDIDGVILTSNGLNALQVDAGSLAKSGQWNDPDIVYWLDHDTTVPAGMTLTVAAGQVIKFSHFAVDLFVEGTLNAQGTAQARITFTESRDDAAGGDTNNDAAASAPGPGNWGRIQLSGSNHVLNHVDVSYGGFNALGQVILDSATATISNSRFLRSAADGLRIAESDPMLTNNEFRNNVGAALSMDLSSDPDIEGVTLENNGLNALQVDAGSLTRSGQWDDPDIVYWLDHDTTVPAGMTLTIAAGQVIKFSHFAVDLLVEGTLHALGTAAAPIIVTEGRDDSAGGDTNNDAAASSPGRGNWGRVQLQGSGNLLEHVDMRYGGFNALGQLILAGAEATVSNSQFSQSAADGIRIENADPELQSNEFRNNAGAAISMDLSSNPTIRDVVVEQNAINGLQVDAGTLAKDLLWDDPDIVYWLDHDTTVPAGTTLTVTAGQVIKFSHFAVDLFIEGTLDARGTLAAPIVFTEHRDDTAGGDTNNDAGGSSPGRGNWGRIQLTGPDNVLDHVDVRYGGFNALGQLIVAGGELTATNSRFRDSAADGIRVENAKPSFTNTDLRDNANAAISMDLASNPSIQGATVTNNAINALQVDSGTLVADAFWDDPDIVYWLDHDINVNASTKLTVAPGQVVKFSHFAVDLFVAGTLDARGTVDQPIIFTENRDDTAGGDTNNDGAASLPGSGNWGRIDFATSSTANRLEHAQIRYGGFNSLGMVQTFGAPLTIANSTLEKSATNALRLAVTTATLTDVAFQDNAGAAISADLQTNPIIDGVTLTNNGANALVLDAGLLYCHAIWDDPEIVYRLSGDLIVPPSVILEIAPGQVVKGRTGAGDEIIVRGTLKAIGTAGNPVVFTSDRDDSAGGDTNNNGATTGSNGNWHGLVFAPTSQNSVLDHAEVRFAGGGGSGAVVIEDSEVVVANSFVRNSSSHAVLARTGATVDLHNNLLVRNSGAGLRVESNATVTATNNTIDGNDRGVFVNSANATLVNNLITHHGRVGVAGEANPTINLQANVLFNPNATSGNTTGITNPIGSNANLAADPLYTNRDGLNYELNANSPAIDSGASAGAPASDFLGRSRIDDPAVANSGSGPVAFVDRGALERHPGAGGEGAEGDRVPSGEDPEFVPITAFTPLPTAASPWTNRFNAWDVTSDGFITPFDVLRVINDLNANGSRRLPDTRPEGSSPLDVNGDFFATPQDALVTINLLNNGDQSPVMAFGELGGFFQENARFIELGQAQGTRSLRIELRAEFQQTDTRPAVEDILLLYLVDPSDPTRTLIDRGTPGTPFFSLAGNKAEYPAGTVRFDGRFIDVDLTAVADLGVGKVVAQFLNSDTDVGGKILVHLAANTLDPLGTPPPAVESTGTVTSVGEAVNLAGFTSTATLRPIVDNVRFHASTGQYEADLRVHNTGPAVGRNVVVALTELPTGVTFVGASGQTPAGEPYINLRNTIRAGGLAAGAISDPVRIQFSDPGRVPFQILPQVLVGSLNAPPQLAAVPPLTVKPGEYLRIPITASDPDGDLVTLSIRGAADLPTGGLHSDKTLAFQPTPDQLGSYSFELVASDGALETIRTVTLDVIPDPLTSTRVSGSVLKTNGDPIVGMPVEIGGVSGLTGSDGRFLLDLGTGPVVSDTIKIRGELFAGAVAYPFIAEKLPLLLERNLVPQVNNVIQRPIFLPELDVNSGKAINPNEDVEVTTAAIPQASVFVEAGTLMNQQGTPFTGVLSITEVPTTLTPAALPGNLNPELVVTIQPGEMVFAQPAPFSLPNLAGYAPGTLMDLWSINPTTGAFEIVGTGQVTPDGSTVTTISGGIRNSSWHFFSNEAPEPTVSTSNPKCPDLGTKETPELGGGTGFS